MPRRDSKNARQPRFPQKDHIIALALSRGLTETQAAEAAGVSRSTVARRRSDADFRALVDDLRQQAYERAAGTLADAMHEASEKLRELARSENEQVALAAAKAVVEWGLKVRDQVDLARQIADLRTAVEGGEPCPLPVEDATSDRDDEGPE